MARSGNRGLVAATVTTSPSVSPRKPLTGVRVGHLAQPALAVIRHPAVDDLVTSARRRATKRHLSWRITVVWAGDSSRVTPRDGRSHVPGATSRRRGRSGSPRRSAGAATPGESGLRQSSPQPMRCAAIPRIVLREVTRRRCAAAPMVVPIHQKLGRALGADPEPAQAVLVDGREVVQVVDRKEERTVVGSGPPSRRA